MFSLAVLHRNLLQGAAVIALTQGFAAGPAAAQECAKDEYVLTLSSIPALREQTVEALERASDKPIEIVDAAQRAMLVEEVGGNKQGGRNNLCEKLRAQRRAALRDVRAGAGPGRIREYRCDCNARLQASKLPDDPMFGLDWGLDQANDVDLDMPEAWERSTASTDVVVAVIDTGVDYNHDDLKDNMWRNPNEIAGNGLDDDGNGYIDDVYGVNTILNNGDPLDDNGHGTHVAGTIGARGNNSLGVAGISWQAKIMAVKFLGSTGSGWLYDAVKSIWYVTYMKNHGVNIRVTNNSWGGGGYYSTLYDAIASAKNAGVLFVAAAGNNTNNNDSNPAYPASYELDNVISVAALDSNGNLAGFSNYGARSVDIAAPGVSIASTYFSNRYVYMSGTSMAAPHVSGALALLAAFAPSFSAEELKQSLLENGKPLISLDGIVASGKIASAGRMIEASYAGPPAVPTATPTPTPPAVTPSPTPTPGGVPTPAPSPTPTPRPGPYTVSGKVTVVIGSTAKAAPGAEVRLHTSQGDQVAFTDAAGNYSFPNIATVTDYTLSVKYTGFEFTPRAGTIDRNWVLNFRSTAETAVLSGLVLRRDKLPIAGALIDGGPLGSATSDSTGQFSFTLPHGSAYRLSITATGYVFLNAEAGGVIHGDVERVFAAEPE